MSTEIDVQSSDSNSSDDDKELELLQNALFPVKEESNQITKEENDDESRLSSSNFKNNLKEEHETIKWKPSEREIQLSNILFGNQDDLVNKFEDVEKVPKKRKQNDLDVDSTDLVNKVLWHDEDDDAAPNEKNSKDKKQRLENKFASIVGNAAWSIPKDPTTVESDSDEEILKSAGFLQGKSSISLPRTILQIKKLKDLNRESYREGPFATSIEFHPTSMVSLVTGYKGCATLFSVDGNKNDKLHSMYFKHFLISSAKFHHGGSKVLFGGNRKFFHEFDLLSGKTEYIPVPKMMTNFKKFKVSPCEKYIAAAGQFGHIYILHPNSYEIIASYKQEYDVTDLEFSPNSDYIFSHSNNSEVSIYDMRANKFLQRFYDDGCIDGTTISISPNSKTLATGSSQGVVNLYNYGDCFTTLNPEPLKRIMNLTTPIVSTKFHPSSEILGICAKNIENAVKMVHVPSATVFSNFPDQQTKLGVPNVLNFSPGGKYFALGNFSQKVALFSLKHYNNY